jgi:hypothetical protein
MAALPQSQTDRAEKSFAASAHFLADFWEVSEKTREKRRSRFQLRQVLCWSYKDSVPEGRGGEYTWLQCKSLRQPEKRLPVSCIRYGGNSRSNA